MIRLQPLKISRLIVVGNANIIISWNTNSAPNLRFAPLSWRFTHKYGARADKDLCIYDVLRILPPPRLCRRVLQQEAIPKGDSYSSEPNSAHGGSSGA